MSIQASLWLLAAITFAGLGWWWCFAVVVLFIALMMIADI